MLLLMDARSNFFLLPGECGLKRSMVRPYEMILANMASVSDKFAETAMAEITRSHYNSVVERELWRFLRKVRG